MNKAFNFLLKFTYTLIFLVSSLIIPYIFMILFAQNIQLLIDIAICLAISLASVLLLWKKIEIKGIKKYILVTITTILSTVSPLILMILFIFSPEQREHDRIMYDICLPALREYYGIKEGESFPDSASIPTDMEGNGKWWYQHLECEQNVQLGKGPIFSDNPSYFHPIK